MRNNIPRQLLAIALLLTAPFLASAQGGYQVDVYAAGHKEQTVLLGANNTKVTFKPINVPVSDLFCRPHPDEKVSRCNENAAKGKSQTAVELELLAPFEHSESIAFVESGFWGFDVVKAPSNPDTGEPQFLLLPGANGGRREARLILNASAIAVGDAKVIEIDTLPGAKYFSGRYKLEIRKLPAKSQ